MSFTNFRVYPAMSMSASLLLYSSIACVISYEVPDTDVSTLYSSSDTNRSSHSLSDCACKEVATLNTE